MPKGILARKLGMTRVFDADGNAVPVTVVEAGPCVVVQKKTKETDGYNAIQLGMGEKRERLFTRAVRGHFKKAGLKPTRYLREIRTDDVEQFQVGQEIKADIFKEGDSVDVTGTSLGKGFSGVVKRWNFRRGPMSHGSMYHRRVGSLGATDPARVFKGRRLPGRLGGERVTVQNLKVVKVDPDRNLLLVRGAVPGRRGGLLIVKESIKKRSAK
ncbi:MAG TPA: 50S ribosomal protein L3 [Firmicutes bacterium]|nr:50S ribosomal protein L3 [Bacillota bacterium]